MREELRVCIQKYMLVELPLRGVPETISQIVFDLGLQGIQTVLAHPERNNHLQNDPRLLLQWYNQGSLIQIDAGSIKTRISHREQLSAGASSLRGVGPSKPEAACDKAILKILDRDVDVAPTYLAE